MLVLGFHGNYNPVHENYFGFPFPEDHDAAAVLLEDGRVVAAIEEERLNRFKHCHCEPIRSLEYCLRELGVGLRDLTRIGVPAPEDLLTASLKHVALRNTHTGRVVPSGDARSVVQRLLQTALRSTDPVADKLHFVEHHAAHAASAFYPSGFERALVVTMDGEGQFNSGIVLDASVDDHRLLAEIPKQDSLGWFYSELIRYLGYWFFDEYKVMGMAPYGDPSRYRGLMRSLYDLGDDGAFQIHRDRFLGPYLEGSFTPRRRGEPVEQAHKDFAAALQEALETIALHFLTHHQRATGHTNLCLAGGVAHNCTLNGKILASGLFEQVFVQPAAHDSGLALGAAFEAHRAATRQIPIAKMAHVFWGGDVGTAAQIECRLRDWAPLVRFTRAERVAATAAQLLAEGRVIGWVQGRSEFGPRALGNRSIVADPRPAANRQIINAMIKKREGYRPFAPSVHEEALHDYFDVPPQVRELPFMIFVCPVREARRAELGAITHVDGSARVQSVSAATNPRYWDLIEEFRRLTGVPMVLNTSFNNDVEPIVDSIDDAIACFLTTGLHHLVIGDFVVDRDAALAGDAALGLVPSIPLYYHPTHTRRLVPERGGVTSVYAMVHAYDALRLLEVTAPVHRVLVEIDGERTLRQAIAAAAVTTEEVLPGVLALWSKRAVLLAPPASGQR